MGDVTQQGWQPRALIGVLGSAAHYTEAQIVAAFRAGREIARLGKTLMTGGTTGIPYAAALGAHSGNAIVVGISPAADLEEHVSRYRKPINQADVLIFSGMGLEGRSPLILRSGKGAIFIGGEFGTLGEFCLAWTSGNNVLGVLEGLGGISDSISALVSKVKTTYGSQVLFDRSPEKLVRRVCYEMEQRFLAKGKRALASSR